MYNELEKFSVDILDDDLVQVFDALHLQQTILGTSRINIKYGFATAPTRKYILYKIIIWFVISLSHIAFIQDCEIPEGALINDFYSKLAHFINFVITLLVILRNIFKNDKYYTLFVNLQKIDRQLHMKSKRVNRYLSIFMRSLTVMTFILGMTWIIMFNLKIVNGFCFATISVWIPVTSNLVDLTVILIIIFFIIIRLSYINDKLKNILEKHQRNTIDYPLDTEYIATETKIWNDLLKAMNVILTVMDDFVELFQFQIFGITCQVLIWTMTTIQCVILTYKNQVSVNPTEATIATSFMLVIITYCIVLCVVSQYLSSEFVKITKFCINIMSSSRNDATRRNVKRMLLLVDNRSDLSVYGLCTLDTQLPTNLLGIFTTYTIVLLQFDLD